MLSCIWMLQDVLLTAVDMMKLEKLELGGRALNLHVQQLHQHFMEAYKVFTEELNDCLDLANQVLKPGGVSHIPSVVWVRENGHVIFC